MWGAMGRERSETGVPVVLLVFAALLGWMGWHYVVSSTPTPAVPDNHGNVSVYTSDPKAAVELWLDPAENSANETLPGFQWVEFSFVVVAKSSPVWWALALGGDAAPPPGELPGSAPADALDHPDDEGKECGPCRLDLFRRDDGYRPCSRLRDEGQLACGDERSRGARSSTGAIARANASMSEWPRRCGSR